MKVVQGATWSRETLDKLILSKALAVNSQTHLDMDCFLKRLNVLLEKMIPQTIEKDFPSPAFLPD